MSASPVGFSRSLPVLIRTNSNPGNVRSLYTAFAVWLIATSAALAQPTNIPAPGATGEWLVAKQYARIKIADCDGRLWGVVAWEAQPGVDSKNPDPNLRTRPTLGMPILLGMTPSQTNRWDGQIYNSQDGHTYSASISLLDPNTLRVQGCFLGFLCGGENWTRVETPGRPGDAFDPTHSGKTIQQPQNNRQSAPAGR